MTAISAILAAVSPGTALGVTASPPSMVQAGSGFATWDTSPIAAVVSDGSGSYTYAWTILSTDGVHGFSALTPTAASTSIRIASIATFDTCTATVRCTVTDTGSGRVGHVDVPVTYYDFGSP